jgi:sugar lactone lactonase YvrE
MLTASALALLAACGGGGGGGGTPITPSGTVTTLSGTAFSNGSADGTDAAALFDTPQAVAVDSSGNVYVADSANHTIRKITPAGVVTQLAGTTGQPGSIDGNGFAANFNGPNKIAVDSSGNLYVADYNNATIRKITSAGDVTTLAGTAGEVGSTDATGADARFTALSGIAVDSSGNVYVSDGTTHVIRKITPAGVVTTLAGTPVPVGENGGFADGTGAAAKFDYPQGVAVDANGNVFVADFNNQAIRKITPAGVVTTFAGAPDNYSGADGVGAAAGITMPSGIAVGPVGSDGYIYFVSEAHTVRKISP